MLGFAIPCECRFKEVWTCVKLLLLFFPMFCFPVLKGIEFAGSLSAFGCFS